MSMREFIRKHRQEIRDAIERAHDENCRPTNDEETALWILNDESLYNWARSEGVNI